MIHVTRLNNEDVIVNSDLIEMIEMTPDTVLTLTTGKKLMVRESSDDVIERVLQYRERVGIRIAHPGMQPPRPADRSSDLDDDDKYEGGGGYGSLSHAARHREPFISDSVLPGGNGIHQ